MKKSILAKKMNSLPRSYLEKSTQDDSFFLLKSLSLRGASLRDKEYYIPDKSDLPYPPQRSINPHIHPSVYIKKLKPGSVCHFPKIKDIFSCILNLMCLFFSFVCHDSVFFHSLLRIFFVM